MTTAALEKRVRTLEREVKTLKTTMRSRAVFTAPKLEKKMPAKKLPAGLRQALREVEQGKVSGPFGTVEELMEHLRG